MNRGLTQKEIGLRVKGLRGKMGLSQEIVAQKIGVSRTAVSQIENAERGISGIELVDLSRLFEVSTDYILGLEKEPEVNLPPLKIESVKNEMRISVPKVNLEKFRQVLLYILERCAGKPNIGETVLYKLLFFSDFNYYESYEEHLTGVHYKKLQYGPIPIEFSKIVAAMEKEGQVRSIKDKYYGYSQKRYVPLIKADLSKLKASEKETIDRVLGLLADKTATEISEYSHEDIPWKATKDKAIIDYELVFYRTPAYSVRSYPEEDSNEI